MSPMTIHVRDDIDDIVKDLSAYEPYSLPLTRRLAFKRIWTPSSTVLASTTGKLLAPFVAAFIDFSRGPETYV